MFEPIPSRDARAACLIVLLFFLNLSGILYPINAQGFPEQRDPLVGYTVLSFPVAPDAYFAYRSLVLFNPNDDYAAVLDVIGIDPYGRVVERPYGPLNWPPLASGEWKIIPLSALFRRDTSAVTVRFIADRPLSGFQLIHHPKEHLLETIPTLEEMSAVTDSVEEEGGDFRGEGFLRNPPRFSATATYMLLVRKTGTGVGTITDGQNLNCAESCRVTQASYEKGASVTLTATPKANSTFEGWNLSSCPGTDSCTVTMTSVRSVTARFTMNPVPDLAVLSVVAPSKGFIGRSLSLGTLVANLGKETAENGNTSQCTDDPEETSKKKCYRVNFYLSADQQVNRDSDQQDPDNDDLHLFGCDMPKLPVKATHSCYGSAKIPNDFKSGQYYILAFADANCVGDSENCELIEISETNNVKATKIVITNPTR